ncbi:MAG: heme-binding protein [Acetobacteraceae bacterium]|nr:heme-binding protein [Acetobacteraceae bacterium]
MRKRGLPTLLVAAILLVAGQGRAQQQAAPSPLDTVPSKMPFDVPYGAPISLERAQAVIAAAMAEAQKRGWKLNFAVVDSGGNLVAFARMDGAMLASITIAQHKARTAATFRRETKVFENGIQGGNAYQLTLDGVIGSRGGIPLVEDGKLIGAVGASGGTGSQDEVCAKAGAAALK